MALPELIGKVREKTKPEQVSKEDHAIVVMAFATFNPIKLLRLLSIQPSELSRVRRGVLRKGELARIKFLLRERELQCLTNVRMNNGPLAYAFPATLATSR